VGIFQVSQGKSIKLKKIKFNELFFRCATPLGQGIPEITGLWPLASGLLFEGCPGPWGLYPTHKGKPKQKGSLTHLRGT
jgi:hypothetical protein